MTGALLLSCLTFLLTVPWGGRLVDELLRRGIGKNIRVEEPDSNQAKAGTATMGGLYFLASLTVVTIILAVLGYREALIPLAAMLAFGLLGAYDDLRGLKDIEAVGWLARSKFSWQWIVAFIVSLAIYGATPDRRLIVPVAGTVIEMGWLFIPVAAFWLVAMSNAVNITDGLDGLAGGVSLLSYAAYGVLAWLMGQEGLALFCFAFVGALLAFLWFNVHPARIFMGDVGSQALGAGLAVVAMLTGHWLLLPLIGLVFIAEALSVMLQVSYFKYTRRKYGAGRRIFRMSPLHYHYQLGGWPEVRVTLRFWIIAVIAAAIGVALGVTGS